METPPPYLSLVDPEERLTLRLGQSRLYYRRLSLGALAAAERQQTVWLPGGPGQAPRPVLPPAALEADLLGRVLLGWQGVQGPGCGLVEYSPQAAQGLPAAVRGLLLRRARRLLPWGPGGR